MYIIKIGIEGKILEGDHAGSNLYIEDDSENTGGYLILVYTPESSVHLHGYDIWVENYKDLQCYFNEANWKINWIL